MTIKTINILIALLLVLMISSTTNARYQTQNELEKQSQQNTQSDTLVFTVYEMNCPGCEGGLENQVNKIESINFSNAN